MNIKSADPVGLLRLLADARGVMLADILDWLRHQIWLKAADPGDGEGHALGRRVFGLAFCAAMHKVKRPEWLGAVEPESPEPDEPTTVEIEDDDGEYDHGDPGAVSPELVAKWAAFLDGGR